MKLFAIRISHTENPAIFTTGLSNAKATAKEMGWDAYAVEAHTLPKTDHAFLAALASNSWEAEKVEVVYESRAWKKGTVVSSTPGQQIRQSTEEISDDDIEI